MIYYYIFFITIRFQKCFKINYWIFKNVPLLQFNVYIPCLCTPITFLFEILKIGEPEEVVSVGQKYIML